MGRPATEDTRRLFTAYNQNGQPIGTVRAHTQRSAVHEARKRFDDVHRVVEEGSDTIAAA